MDNQPDRDEPQVDERFRQIMARAEFKSEDVTQAALEEAEPLAVEALIGMLDISTPPNVRFKAAQYIMELNGHVPGQHKMQIGTDALVAKLTHDEKGSKRTKAYEARGADIDAEVEEKLAHAEERVAELMHERQGGE